MNDKTKRDLIEMLKEISVLTSKISMDHDLHTSDDEEIEELCDKAISILNKNE